jgi:hypothetical protein
MAIPQDAEPQAFLLTRGRARPVARVRRQAALTSTLVAGLEPSR